MKYESFIREGLLCWTLTNNSYKYITWNLIMLCRRAGVGPVLVVCADKASHGFFVREGVQSVLCDTPLPDMGADIITFGSKNFMTLNRMKLNLLNQFAADPAVEKCVYMDGDIAVYKNFLPDIRQRLSEHPLWFQCDEVAEECTSGDYRPCENFCTGFIAFCHGADKGIFKLTDNVIWAEKPEDQVWVNKAIARLSVVAKSLPRDLYPNGRRANLTQMNPDLKQKAMLLHYNYRVGNVKVKDMKRYGDWVLPY